MARIVKEAQLGSRTARSKLQTGRQPHWRVLAPGTTLGWQRRKGERDGRWLLRRHIGPNRYSVYALGRADDVLVADGGDVLDFQQAEAKARAMLASQTVGGKIEKMTVRQALAVYVEHKLTIGQPAVDAQSRGAVHILPTLGDLVVSELTRELLQKWLATMANAPAQTRPQAGGKPHYRPGAKTEEEKRARRVTANRVLTILKAVLNHAFREGHISVDTAWRRVKPFKNVDQPRTRYLSLAEAQRLLNAANPDFRALVRGALETGCRYGELCRLEVHDFNPDAETITIGKSKTGKTRHVILTPEGAAFFRQHCAGRSGGSLMFQHSNGKPWRHSEQAPKMYETIARANITPTIGFHGLRHTYASHCVMNGVPLMVIARNLGHADTTQVQKTYGHMSPSYITEAIKAGAPRFDMPISKKVVPLH